MYSRYVNNMQKHIAALFGDDSPYEIFHITTSSFHAATVMLKE